MVNKLFRIMRNAFLVIFSFLGIYLSNKSKVEQDVKDSKKDFLLENSVDGDDDGERAAFNLYHFKFQKIDEVKDDRLEEYKDELLKFQKLLPKISLNEKIHKKIEEELILIDKRIEQREELDNLENITTDYKKPANQEISEEVLLKQKFATKIKDEKAASNILEDPSYKRTSLSLAATKKPKIDLLEGEPIIEEQPETLENYLSITPILTPLMVPLAVVPSKAKITKPLPRQEVKPYFSKSKSVKGSVMSSPLPLKYSESLKTVYSDNKINLPIKPVIPLKETLMASKMIDDDIANNEKMFSSDISLKDINHLLKKTDPTLPLLLFRKRSIKKLFSQIKLHNNLNSINKKLKGIVKPYKHLSFLTLFSKKRILIKTKEALMDNLDNLYNLKISLYKNYGDEADTDEFQELLRQIENMELDLQSELVKSQKKELKHKVKKKSLFGKYH